MLNDCYIHDRYYNMIACKFSKCSVGVKPNSLGHILAVCTVVHYGCIIPLLCDQCCKLSGTTLVSIRSV